MIVRPRSITSGGGQYPDTNMHWVDSGEVFGGTDPIYRLKIIVQLYDAGANVAQLIDPWTINLSGNLS